MTMSDGRYQANVQNIASYFLEEMAEISPDDRYDYADACVASVAGLAASQASAAAGDNLQLLQTIKLEAMQRFSESFDENLIVHTDIMRRIN